MILDHCRKCEAILTTLDSTCPRCHAQTPYNESSLVVWGSLVGVGVFLAIVAVCCFV